MGLPSQDKDQNPQRNGAEDGANPVIADETAVAPSESPTSRTVSVNGSQFTNQQLIDAFANVAGELGYEEQWALLERAGLSLDELIRNRNALYSGTALGQLPNLSMEERALLLSEVNELIQAQFEDGGLDPAESSDELWVGRVTAPSGLNLRMGPGSQHAALRILTDGTRVRVLSESEEWLHVEVMGQSGFVSRSYVERTGESDTAGGTLRLPPNQKLDVPAGASDVMVSIVNLWNNYGTLITAEADRLGIEPGLAVAVLLAESRGEPFGSDGRMIIRFENHIFHQEWGQWGAQNRQRFDAHFRFDSARLWDTAGQQWRLTADGAWQPVHASQNSEWNTFTFARSLDETAALRSISMGMAQIMGFNFRHAGYSSETQMFHAFQSSAEQQVAGFFRFIESQAAVGPLRAGDLHEFARIYNGEGQAQLYADIIANRQQLFQQVAESVLADMQQRGMMVPAARSALPETQLSTRETTPSIAIPQAESTRSPVVPPPAHLPFPVASTTSLADVDPELYAAWRQHVIDGFEKNNQMFDRILDGFMKPYNITITMNRIIFGVGIAAFVLAAILSVWTENTVAGLLFGGLGAVAFISYFLSRPTQALEENLQFITWLGIIYNTYWTRLAYSMDLNTVQEDIEDATNDAVGSIKELLDKHAELSGKRPNVQ